MVRPVSVALLPLMGRVWVYVALPSSWMNSLAPPARPDVDRVTERQGVYRPNGKGTEEVEYSVTLFVNYLYKIPGLKWSVGVCRRIRRWRRLVSSDWWSYVCWRLMNSSVCEEKLYATPSPRINSVDWFPSTWDFRTLSINQYDFVQPPASQSTRTSATFLVVVLQRIHDFKNIKICIRRLNYHK